MSRIVQIWSRIQCFLLCDGTCAWFLHCVVHTDTALGFCSNAVDLPADPLCYSLPIYVKVKPIINIRELKHVHWMLRKLELSKSILLNSDFTYLHTSSLVKARSGALEIAGAVDEVQNFSAWHSEWRCVLCILHHQCSTSLCCAFARSAQAASVHWNKKERYYNKYSTYWDREYIKTLAGYSLL